MAKEPSVDQVTEEKIRNGGILARFYFDVQHKEKEKLQPALVDLVNNRLLKETGVVYGFGKIEEPIEKDGIFITSAVVTILFEGLAPLINVVFNYAPAGVEVLKPEKELHVRTPELQSLLIDLSNVSINYSKYILEKVLTPEEVRDIKKQLENRAAIGKEAMGKFDKDDKK